MKDHLLRIAALTILAILLPVFQSQAQAEVTDQSIDNGKKSFVILGCSQDCTYDTFIQALNVAVTDLEIAHEISGGSRDNVTKLDQKSADFAIVQADVLYNSYRGRAGAKRIIGYSALLPLFPNYVQLLARRGSGIENLADLKGKRVNLGREGSGTRSNALDILSLAKLDPEDDIVPVETSGKKGIAQFAIEQGVSDAEPLDALFVTGKLRVPQPGDNYYHVALPQKTIDKLVQTPFYTEVGSPAVLYDQASGDPLLQFNRKMLSLTAYLVASDSADHNSAETLLRSVVGSWQRIQVPGAAGPMNPESAFSKLDNPPVPYHPKTREVLTELGYLDPIPQIKILGGSLGGTYKKFIDVLNVEHNKREFLHVQSGGSKDNLERLANVEDCSESLASDEACFAIAQDDAAFNRYYQGSTLRTRLPWSVNFLHENFGPGFRAVLPLFPNYVQVLVNRESGIEDFDDLKGKRVGIGAEGSATLSNATDVLLEAQITIEDQPDFEKVSSGAGIKRLKKGVSEADALDALFVTGMLRVPPEDGAFRHLPIPEGVLNKLTNSDKPYYVKISSPEILEDFNAPMLSLTAYLIASDNASDESIEIVINSLTESWPAISDQYGWRLKNLEDVGTRTPIPFHPMTNKVLAESKYVTPEKVYYPYLIGLALVISVLFYVMRWIRKDTYNRLGQEAHLSSVLLDKFSPWFAAVYVAALFFTFLLLVVIFVNAFEGALSIRSNVENSFFKLGIWDSILWIFTFMATGYENDVYPASTYSKIVVAIAAMVGLVAPFALAYSGVSKLLEKRFSRLSGDSAFHHLRDHVLICGWNAKVKYLIWTLTGEDAPSKKQVLVIADIEGDKPLTRYNFDKDLVNYCRGDSADSSVLERANAKDASLAIVVADDKKLETDNLGSALTVLALRRKNADMFIASELDSEQNRLFFDASGSDAIVDSRFLSDRLLTLSCLYPLLCDFVLDGITHDEYSEFYSQSVEELRRKFSIEDREPSLASLQDHAHLRGLNIVGAEKPIRGSDERASEDGLVNKYAINLLLSSADMQETLADSDTVVLAADDLAAIGSPACNQGMGELSPNAECPRLLEETHPQRILIVGGAVRAEGVMEKLGLASTRHEVTVLSPEDDTATIERQIQDLIATRPFDSVLVLNQALGIDSLSDQKSFIGDAKVILRVQLITRLTRDNPEFCARSTPPRIVAEVNQQKNRRLLVEAGATTIVPSLLMTARFLTKLVYGRGHVYRLIVTLLTMKEGTYLRSLELKAGHPLIGKTYLESLRTVFEDARIIGYLPSDKQVMAELKNEEEDFATHFVMSPLKENVLDKKRRGPARRNDADRILSPGDTLILIGSDH